MDRWMDRWIDQTQNQVSLAKQVCTNKEFDLVKWLSVCLHRIYIQHQTIQYKQCNGLRSLKKYIQGGMAIYRSFEFYHNNSAKKWRVQEVQGQIFYGMSIYLSLSLPLSLSFTLSLSLCFTNPVGRWRLHE